LPAFRLWGRFAPISVGFGAPLLDRLNLGFGSGVDFYPREPEKNYRRATNPGRGRPCPTLQPRDRVRGALPAWRWK
jgi:hypothetical protein